MNRAPFCVASSVHIATTFSSSNPFEGATLTLSDSARGRHHLPPSAAIETASTASERSHIVSGAQAQLYVRQ
jgi:hypothetical protein